MARKLSIIAIALIVSAPILYSNPTAQVAAPDKKKTVNREGRKLFARHCASCHGIDADGKGEVAGFLKGTPPDLTTLTRQNGGEFPTLRVQQIISGEKDVGAHSTREMPVWGTIVRRSSGDSIARLQIYNLAKYIESVQK